MPTAELRIRPGSSSKKLPNPNVYFNFSPGTVKKKELELISFSSGHFHGSVFVSILCRLFLEGTGFLLYNHHLAHTSSNIGFLAESDFLDDLDHIVRCFDKTTKLRFRSADEPQFVKFGSTRDNDEDCNIRYGQLKMTG